MILRISPVERLCAAHWKWPPAPITTSTWNGWVRLKYEMTDYWTGEPLEIDDKIFLATSRHRSAACGWASPGRFTEFPVLGACAGLTKILEDVGSEMRDFGLRSRRGHRAE
jgi:hypothetical protein